MSIEDIHPGPAGGGTWTEALRRYVVNPWDDDGFVAFMFATDEEVAVARAACPPRPLADDDGQDDVPF